MPRGGIFLLTVMCAALLVNGAYASQPTAEDTCPETHTSMLRLTWQIAVRFFKNDPLKTGVVPDRCRVVVPPNYGYAKCPAPWYNFWSKPSCDGTAVAIAPPTPEPKKSNRSVGGWVIGAVGMLLVSWIKGRKEPRPSPAATAAAPVQQQPQHGCTCNGKCKQHAKNVIDNITKGEFTGSKVTFIYCKSCCGW